MKLTHPKNSRSETDGNIDAISTATMSRNGIQEAVNKALEKASGPKEESKKGFTPGTYEGEGKGYSETAPVKVKVTVDAEKITAVEIDAPEEQPFGVPNFPKYIEALIGRTDGYNKRNNVAQRHSGSCQ